MARDKEHPTCHQRASAPAAGKCEVDVTLEGSLNEGKHGFRSDALLTQLGSLSECWRLDSPRVL
jgi:hypothetical protein